MREVALLQLLAPVRKTLHRRVAEALRHLHARDLASHALAIGTHYLNAETWDQAAAFFGQAGDTAFAQTGRREAATCYERALAAVTAMPGDQAARELACELHYRIGRVLYSTGDFSRARQSFARAESLAQALGDDRRQAKILGGLAYLLGSEGEHTAAAEAGSLALSIARSVGDLPLQMWTSVALGRQHFAEGRYRLGVEGLQWVVETLRTQAVDLPFGPGTLLPAVAARTWIALCRGQLGEFSEAIAWGEEAIRIADTMEVKQELVWACYCLGQVLVLRGDAARGQPLLERAVALCEDGRFPIYAPRALASLGVAYARGGRLQEALAVLERAAEEASAINLGYGQAMVIAMLAHTALATGGHDRARELSARCLAIARARGERGDEAWALYLVGSVVARSPGVPEAAQGPLGEALALAGRLDMRPLEARARLALGRVHAAAGRPERARAEITRALAGLRTMGMTLWAEEAEALLARLG